MGGAPDLSRLEETVRRAGESLVGIAGNKSAKQEMLRDIFRMNHEIGRIAREFPSIAPALREMQLEVNFVTIRSRGTNRKKRGLGLREVDVLATEGQGLPGSDPRRTRADAQKGLIARRRICPR